MQNCTAETGKQWIRCYEWNDLCRSLNSDDMQISFYFIIGASLIITGGGLMFAFHRKLNTIQNRIMGLMLLFEAMYFWQLA